MSKPPAKTFRQLTLDEVAAVSESLGNLASHPGFQTMLEVLERLEQSCLLRLGECNADELGRLQGERAAVVALRSVLVDLPAAQDAIEAAIAEEHEDSEAQGLGVSDADVFQRAHRGLFG